MHRSVGGIVVIVLLLGCGFVFPRALPRSTRAEAAASRTTAPVRRATLGIVEQGRFLRLDPPPRATLRLTRMGMPVANAPEREEVDLAPYEGKALLVTGDGGSDWIYSAKIVDVGSPIVTTLTRKTFAAPGKTTNCLAATTGTHAPADGE